MDASDRPAGGTLGALMEAMDLLEQLPPAGPVLRERGYDTESDLIHGLGDPDATVRRGCLELLADPRGVEAVPRVLARLDDPEWEVRYCAVHALGRQPRSDTAAAAPGTDTATGSDARPDTGSDTEPDTEPDTVVPAVINTVRTDSSRYVRMLAVELVADAAAHDLLAAQALVSARDRDADIGVRRKAARYARRGEIDPGSL